jgi:protein phosphatase
MNVVNLEIPDLSLVLLVGATSSGKSSFARKHFLATEVISSDACRGLVADDENAMDATGDAFDLLQYLAGKRLKRGRLTVIDATNVKREDRQGLVALAREHHCLATAIVFDLPEATLLERHRARADRDFGVHVVRNQLRALDRERRGMKREGFHRLYVLDRPEAVDAATVERVPLWSDRRGERGPFDLIGDVHGCYDELVTLLERLGYTLDTTEAGEPTAHPPEGRKALFLGDLVDRGPRSPDVLRLVMNMVASGAAMCVPGNHDVKLEKKLRGRDVRVTHGLAETLEQLEPEDDAFRERVADFVRGLVSHLVLDGGKLVVAHAGLKEAYQGRGSARVRDFCLYGETTGETDAYGLPVRYDWAAEYRGVAMVGYGHTPVPRPEWINRTICIDTGCVFGGSLTALRYPEEELVSVPALRTWYEPVRPLAPVDERAGTDVLDLEDVTGRRHVETRLGRTVSIGLEHAAAALEVMSRFAVDPHWLVYLPPTMSPSETAPDGAPVLEHPREALAHYRKHGVKQAIVEEKHMGSRAVVVVCRDPSVGPARFGVAAPSLGAVTTRTGRPFFRDPAQQAAFLERVGAGMAASGLWDELDSDWAVLDAEILPWSAKALELLRAQYAPAGAAGVHVLGRAAALLEQAALRDPSTAALCASSRDRLAAVERFREAYRRYCWDVDGLDGLRLAPFHLLASEGRVHTDRDHLWHMGALGRLAATGDPLFVATSHRVVDLGDEASEAEAIAWWEALTASGGEGAVVKPFEWLAFGRKGLLQPALKCRGAEYLRIIYGAEYTLPHNLERLRARGLSRKRSLALRELALGLEALHRFVERQPLYRVHECVFGVLALESEPVDPRL